MSKAGRNIAKNLEKNLGPEIAEKWAVFVPKLIEVYTDTYEDELLSVVTDKDSLSNPEYFYDDYVRALDNFEYVGDKADGLVLRIPTKDTFPFPGRMDFIKQLMEGTVGNYLELPQEDYDELKNNKDLSDNVRKVVRNLPHFFDSDTPKELRFYFVHTRGTLYKTIESILDKKLVVFPFSNTSEIPLFERGEKFFEDNIRTIFKESTDTVNDKYRGA